jgi:hypothetical protein
VTCHFCPSLAIVTIGDHGFCADCAAVHRQVALDKLDSVLAELRRIAATTKETVAA